MTTRLYTIRKNKKTDVHGDFLFFDVESYLVPTEDARTEHVFRLGYADYVRVSECGEVLDEKDCAFRSVEAFINFLYACLKGRTNIHVIAHNINYDAQVTDLPRRLMADGWELTSFYVNALTVIVSFKRGKQTLVLEDGLNRLRGSIAELGRTLGVEKLTVDFENVDDDTLAVYCQRDVHILRDSTLNYIKFVFENDLGKLKRTVASQSFTAFKHRFMKVKLYHHNDPIATRMEREAYHGGMVRVMKVVAEDSGDFYQLDINSMYPYVMKQYLYPSRFVGFMKNPTLEKLREVCENGCVIARLTVEPKSDCFTYTQDGRSYYPKYRFTSCFTTPEVVRLLDENAIVEIHEVACYLKRDIFSSHIDFFYSKRQEFKEKGDKPNEQLTKLFLNSLYGKFGAHSSSYKRTPEYDDYPADELTIRDEKTKTQKKIVKWLGMAFCLVENEEGRESMPSVAAHVTAYARLYLYDLIQKAGRENVYYMDTDSLLVNREGYENLKDLLDPKELGKLKLEKHESLAIILGRKDYILGNKIVRKGVDIQQAANGIDVNTCEIWPTLKTYWSRESGNNYQTFTMQKHYKRELSDGYIADNGDVIPFDKPPTRLDSTVVFLQNNPVFQQHLANPT